jgi:hypothetical protein
VQIWRSLADVPADLGATVVVIGNVDIDLAMTETTTDFAPDGEPTAFAFSQGVRARPLTVFAG